MDLRQFKASLRAPAPPQDISPPLQALWWAAKDGWTQAHEIAQAHDNKDAAWVHAYLHRVEGDLANAAYWYRLAQRRVESGNLPAEWEAIVTALLQLPRD